jgi:hypothetical protein
MVVYQADEEYGVDLRVFFKTHRPLADRANHYIKDAQVRALRVSVPTDLVTNIEGREEMRSVVPPGAYIIQNPDGELYYNDADKFAETYEPVES